MKKILTQILDYLGLAYWIEITTETPICTYYFGPFLSKQEAILAQTGYVEDLKGEEAQGIKTSVKRCKPKQLTIFDESEDKMTFKPVPILGTQY